VSNDLASNTFSGVLAFVDSVNKTYRFLCRLFDEKEGGELILRLDEGDVVPQWDDPDPV